MTPSRRQAEPRGTRPIWLVGALAAVVAVGVVVWGWQDLHGGDAREASPDREVVAGDPDPRGEVELALPEDDDASAPPREVLAGPEMQCRPVGCERWRLTIEPGWELAGAGEGTLGLVGRPDPPEEDMSGDDGSGMLTLRVVDAATGAQRWQATVDVASSEAVAPGSPIEVAFAADLAVVALGTRLVAIRPDGTVAWESPLPGVELLRLRTAGEALVVTVEDRSGPSSAWHLVVNHASGEPVFEVRGHPHVLLDDQALIVAVPDEAGYQVRRVGLTDGGIVWERASQGWTSFPRTGFASFGPTIGVVPIVGAGVDGGDLLVDRWTGEELVDTGGMVAGGVSLTTGSTVILLDTAPSAVSGARSFQADWFSLGGPQQLELLIIDPDGQPGRAIPLEVPLDRSAYLAADRTRVSVIDRTGATATFETRTADPQPVPTELLDEPRSYTWRDPTGRQITRTPDRVLVEVGNAAAQVTGRDLRLANETPTVVQQGVRLLGIEPVSDPLAD